MERSKVVMWKEPGHKRISLMSDNHRKCQSIPPVVSPRYYNSGWYDGMSIQASTREYYSIKVTQIFKILFMLLVDNNQSLISRSVPPKMQEWDNSTKN